MVIMMMRISMRRRRSTDPYQMLRMMVHCECIDKCVDWMASKKGDRASLGTTSLALSKGAAAGCIQACSLDQKVRSLTP